MTLLIKNGHVLDPATETDEEIDIFIEDGKIAKRGKKLKCKAERVMMRQAVMSCRDLLICMCI